MSEKILNINGIEICAETFGDRRNPPILLIMGAMASMVWWDAEFCRKLADCERFVIRFDNRDVGRSTVYEPGTNHYTVEDMTDDAVGVLDAFNIERAHFVGMSLGGMISQVAALRHAERVLTITLIASSVFAEIPELPPIDARILEFHASGAELDWTDKKAVADYMVEGWRLMHGSRHEFDVSGAYKLAETEIARAENLLSMFNHATLGGGEQYYDRIKEIKIPALAIHGTEDPVLPFPHALAIVDEIPGTKLLTLEGAGHEIQSADWDEIVGAIIEHTN